MTKYLFYTENHVFGGGNKYMFDLMQALINDSNQIFLYCNHKGLGVAEQRTLDPRIILKHIKIFHINFLKNLYGSNKIINRLIYLISILIEPFLILLNIFYLIPNILKANPDQIVVCNGGYPAALSCLSMIIVGKVCRIPVVVSIVSMPVIRRKFIAYYDKLLDYCIWNSIEFAIVNCNSIKNNLNLLRGLPLDKIHVIYNAIKNKQQRLFNIFEKNEVTIGCISRLDFNKGVMILLEVFKKLSHKYNYIRLLLVGTGDAYKDLQGKIQEYGLDNNIKLTGFFDGDIFTAFEQIDLFVLPSFWEGLPYSVIEACSCGRAIVATDVGGIREIIENNVSGILVPPRSEEGLLNAIEFCLNNRDIAKKMGMHARQTYEKKFNLEGMYEKVRQILK